MLAITNGVKGEATVTAKIVGVDGAKGRWLAVWRVDDGFQHAVYATPELLMAQHHLARVIAVDIPMGLTDAGSRPTDVLARRFVGAKREVASFQHQCAESWTPRHKQKHRGAIAQSMGAAMERRRSQSLRTYARGIPYSGATPRCARTSTKFIPRFRSPR